MADNNRERRVGEEYPPANEAAAIEEIVQFQLEMMKQLDPRKRGQHAKGHGCLRAEFTVLDNLPDPLAHGVFSRPRTFPALIRFSNAFSPDDRLPDFHGMAVKLIGVSGAGLPDDERDAGTQDFLMIDAPAFFAADVRTLLDFMLDKSRLDARGMAPGDVLEQLAVTHPHEVALFGRYIRNADASPLVSRYWSCVPVRLGRGAMKYHASPGPSNSEGQPQVNSENFLREAMIEHLTVKRLPAHFDFLVQRQLDAESMPIEDATVEWESPFEQVAAITIPPQSFDSAEQLTFGENLSFSTWHALPDHRPLGGLNRSRLAAYKASSELRHRLCVAPMKEPVSIEECP